MKIFKLMHKNPKVAEPNQTLTEAANIMKKIGAGVLPVVEAGKVIGMITDRDITVRATAKGKNPNDLLVRDVMTEDAVCCFESDNIFEAGRKMMENNIGRLPVLSKRGMNLAGIISLADIISEFGGRNLVEGRNNLPKAKYAIPALAALAAIGFFANKQMHKNEVKAAA